MKVTKEYLENIIKEETSLLLQETISPAFKQKVIAMEREMLNQKTWMYWAKGQIQQLHRMIADVHPQKPWNEEVPPEEFKQ